MCTLYMFWWILWCAGLVVGTLAQCPPSTYIYTPTPRNLTLLLRQADPVAACVTIPGPFPVAPVDIYLLWDAGYSARAFSYHYWRPNSRRILKVMNATQQANPNVRFGLGFFTTKRLFNIGVANDFVFRHAVNITANISAVDDPFVDSVWSKVKSVSPITSSLEAFVQVVLASNNTGFRPGSRRIVLIATDIMFGQQGDVGARIYPGSNLLETENATTVPFPRQNNYDGVLDGSCTVSGNVCRDVCTIVSLGPPATRASNPSVDCYCGGPGILWPGTLSAANVTQFAAGSCEDFPAQSRAAEIARANRFEIFAFVPIDTLGTNLTGAFKELNILIGGGAVVTGLELRTILPPLVPQTVDSGAISVTWNVSALTDISVGPCNMTACTFCFTFEAPPGVDETGTGITINGAVYVPVDTHVCVPSQSQSQSQSPSSSGSQSLSDSQSSSESRSSSGSQSPSESRSPSESQSRSKSQSRSGSQSPSASPSASESKTVSASESHSPTPSGSQSLSESPTPSKSQSASASKTVSASESRSPTPGESTSQSRSPPHSASQSDSRSDTISESASASPTPGETTSHSGSQSPSGSESASASQTPSGSASSSGSPTPIESRSESQPESRSQTQSGGVTSSASASASSSPPFNTYSQSPSKSPSESPSFSATSASPSATQSLAETGTPSLSPTPSATGSQSRSAEATQTPSLSPTPPATRSQSPSPEPTQTPSLSPTPGATRSQSRSHSASTTSSQSQSTEATGSQPQSPEPSFEPEPMGDAPPELTGVIAATTVLGVILICCFFLAVCRRRWFRYWWSSFDTY